MEKVTAQEIQRMLMRFIQNSYDIVLPNHYYGINECDVFRITESNFVFEYEIKVSRSDFFADFKKSKKHKNLAAASGEYCPNRFFYVVPKGLITKDEVPAYAGLLTYDGGTTFTLVKHAKLLHKKTFTKFRYICHTLSWKCMNYRSKILRAQKGLYKEELAEAKRIIKSQEKLINELCTEKMELKAELRKAKKESYALSE